MHDAPADVEARTRSQRLKAATGALHEALDARMSGADLFSSRERYGLFLDMQRRFHRDIEALYREPALEDLVPDLAQRRKLDLIDLDLADIGRPRPEQAPSPVDPSDPAAALGWLYVAEGSSLGAAFLLKAAAGIGLGEDFGARHLAGHKEGRGLHWRRFTQSLDAAPLTPEEDARAEAAAVTAFGHVQGLAEDALAEDNGGPPASARKDEPR